MVFASVALPLLRDGHNGKEHAFRAADALGVSFGAAELLKALTHEQRPNGSSHDSMPSGHTALAFAAATMAAANHPREAPLWFGAATLVGWSRVSLRDHHTYDVLVGGLIGYGAARLELSSRHGIILSPWIGRDSGSAGLSMHGTF